ncbi:nuclear cap-binding protein subunit 3-like [Onthophagus taurus]|uniref:nuclear cap-binding protein subunit 3-like n=1 Tax=Onthophagus taurus TaxID=166361 RepID=UPI0039BDC834
MTESLRPNIRIEIQNDLTVPMEVEEDKLVEDGEINDPEEEIVVERQKVVRQTQRVWSNSNGGFSTGINIFDKIEQTKLLERAKRFDLKPNEICNFTDEQLQQLHDSLGITTEDEKDIRFESLHMRGTDNLSTEDVLEYFGKYGPSGVEWINDESCNILFDDKVSAARALFYLSKPIKGMPVEGPCDPFVKELDSNKENGKSILLKSRTVELKDDSDDVSLSDITVPIPPGYWRLGMSHTKSRCILVRFALKSDKKQLGAEKFSEYYKKYGNPNYGGMKGLISETQKKKFKGIVEDVEDSKNPWGLLAKNWNQDMNQTEKEIPIIPIKTKSDVMSRIGFKRTLEDEPIKEEQETNEKKRSKIPRMRMYADEEEERIKRRKELQKIKNVANESKGDDLRDVLKSQIRKNVKLEREEKERKDPEPDLGLKLKNRIRNQKKDDLTQEKSKYTDKNESRRKLDDLRKKRLSPRLTSPSRTSPRRFLSKGTSPNRFSRRMRSDYSHLSDYEDSLEDQKPKSKVTVVIKTQKKPTVASTIWSRINSDRERLKTVSEGKLRRRSSSSESSGGSNSGNESSDQDDEVHVKQETDVGMRPGFHANVAKRLHHMNDHRSPLRIEINNDHFKKE